jgi:glycosylphosphatidylinositol phospholipase D
MNGDGYADFVIGGMGVNSAYVYFGGPNGPGSNPVTLVGPGDIHGQFGIAVSGAGDVNGDGLSDLAVGAIFAGNPGTAGAAYVVLGAPQGLVPTPISLVDKSASAAPEAGVGYDLFGDAVAGGGDVDQDGYDDVIVGAYDVNRTFLFFGSAAGPSMSPVTLAGPQGRFGGSVAE